MVQYQIRLDDRTDDNLCALAEHLRESKSAVMRRAVRELAERELRSSNIVPDVEKVSDGA